MDERRIVTMLFADLVGSTAVAEQLHPEEAKLVLGDAVARVISAVESYGGYIKDIAGDGVLAFFGAPVAHEDDSERAIRAGLEVVQTVAVYSEQVEQGWGVTDLSVRVGVHTGEVVVGLVGGGTRHEYGAVGDAVNVAARLQSEAEPGTVLVSAATKRPVSERFSWGLPRELQLKGKSELVTAFPASGLAVGSAEWPPARVSTPLVGRDSELQALEAALDGLGEGHGGILVISGEAGIGKSRLVAELRGDAAERGIDWVEGRCVSYGESLPYWPYRDLLGSWLGLTPQAPEVKARVTWLRRLEEILPGRSTEMFPYFATIVGLQFDDADGLSQVAPEAIQYRTFEVVCELIGALAAERPLVVSLDDVHWADPTSLALTERLMAVAEVEPVLLVLTVRPETDHASWQLKEQAAREYRHVFRELSLGSLSTQAEATLLSSLIGGRPLAPGTSQTVLEYSAGNPLYLEEIVRSLDETEASWTVRGEVQVPPSVDAIVVARIDRLEPTWRELLTAASVLGRSFTTAVLCAVTGQDEPTVRSALHHLLRLDLMEYDRSGAEPAYRFKHALVQEAAHRTLTASHRGEINARAAEWFESFYEERGAAGLIAHHWLEAGQLESAARFLRLAGDHALSRWALDEAIDHYRSLLRVLEQLGEAAPTAELLFKLGSTLHLAFRIREANAVWTAAFARWTFPEPPQSTLQARLRIATNQVPWSAAPALGYYATNQALLRQLRDGLLEGRPGPYVVPGLASSWSVSEDGLRYRFHLRADTTWNDGTPVLAEDVVRAYRRIVDPVRPSMNAPMALVVANAEERLRGDVSEEAIGVQAVEERTVEIRLTRPYPAFLFYAIYPEFSALASTSEENGPFRLESMEEGRVVASRHTPYPRRRGGNVESIEWLLIRDPDELAELARRNEVDAAWGNVPLAVAPEDVGLSVLDTPRTQTGFVAFIGSGPFASDAALRHALALATNREILAKELPPHLTIASGGLVPPGLAGHTPDVALPFDPDQARRALDTSSHVGPLAVMLAREQHLGYLDVMADMWREQLGLEVRVLEEPMADSATWQTRCHVAYWQWVAHAPDPEYFLWNLLHSTSSSKLGGWSSAQLDALLDRARRTADGAQRLDLDHQADRLAVEEECLIIPIAYGGTRWLVKPWVHGIWQWGAPWQSLDEVTIDKTSPHALG